MTELDRVAPGAQGNDSAPRTIRVACLLMQRNERDLLGPWMAYHSALFGSENLFVFDNGSTDYETRRVLSEFERRGVNVDYSHSTRYDFTQKGSIISSKIKSIDDGTFDFFFPLDCDEFLGVHDESRGTWASYEKIAEELALLRNDPKVLTIGYFLFNDPGESGRYLLFRNPQKCFFAAGACEYLDIGYHAGRAKTTSEQHQTSIAYFHYHNRPHKSYLYYAKQKMFGRLEDWSPSGMKKYIEGRGAGGHLVDRMLMSEDEYNAQFQLGSNRPFPVHGIVHFGGLAGKLSSLGWPITFSSALDRGPQWRPRSLAGQLLRALGRITRSLVESVPPNPCRLQHLSVSFGTGPIPSGFVQVGERSFYEPSKGFGWLSVTNLMERDRGFDDLEMRGFVLSFGTATFRAALVPGRYRLRLRCFDPLFGNHVTQLEIADQLVAIPEIRLKPYEAATLTIIFDISGDFVDLQFSSPLNNWIVNSLVLQPTEEEPSVKLDIAPMPANLWALPLPSDRSARGLIERWLGRSAVLQAPQQEPSPPTYLSTIARIVDYFAPLQDANGAIVDPHLGREVQYSTPCFAYAAALLARHAGRPDLVAAAARAMTWACECLATGRAADRHEDFFAAPIAYALPLLEGEVPSETSNGWRNTLQSYDPLKVYRHPMGGTGGDGSNWNCKALVGEYLLYKQDVRPGLDFVTVSLLAQGRMFNNEYGLYAEGPMVYDAFPRAWLGLMCAAGYEGRGSIELREALERAALASLLIQSPSGELPCGGRSSHHQWADALQCVTFELYASVFAMEGNNRLGGILRRAARRAHEGMLPWLRPTGEFSILKNRAAPIDRHGFEVYSAHSQYNLLAATALGFAYQSMSSLPIVEMPTPAETGDYALVLPPPFNKVVANCAGTYVLVCLKREREGTAGFLRVHFLAQSEQIGPSDALLAAAGHHLPGGERIDLAIGANWMEKDGSWRSLADLSSDAVSAEVQIKNEDSTLVAFDVVYRLSNSPVEILVEQYELRNGEVRIRYRFANRDGERSIAWPVLVNDGASSSDAVSSGRVLVAQRGTNWTEYEVSGCSDITLSQEHYPHRNGFMRVARAVVRPEEEPMLAIRGHHGVAPRE